MSMKHINFQVPNPLQGMAQLQRGIALPHENSPVRYPSFPALERTAVMGFNLPVAVNVPTGSASMRALLMRQASYPFWLERSTTSFIQLSNYLADDELFLNGVTEVPILLHPRPKNVGCRNQPASVNTVGISGAIPPQHTYPLLGVFDVAAYTYVPAGSTWGFVVSTASNNGFTAAVSVVYEMWDTRDKVTHSSTVESNIATASGCLTGPTGVPQFAAVSFYMRPVSLTIRRTDAPWTFSSPMVSVVVSTGTPVYAASTTTRGIISPGAGEIPLLFPIGPPPEISVSERPYADTRVTAAAVLITNVTKVLDKEGTVLAGRLKHDADCYNFVGQDLSELHPAEKAFLPLATGCYTYAPPSTDMSGFYDYTLKLGLYDGGGGSVDTYIPIVRLDNSALVNCLMLSDPDLNTRSSFAVNVDWHVEFRNNSTLFEIGMSTITLEAYHQAILQLVSHGFFFSNDGHKSLIGKIIKMLPLPPGVAQVASIGVDVYDHIMSKKLNTTPSTTKVDVRDVKAKGPGETKPKYAKSQPEHKKNKKVVH